MPAEKEPVFRRYDPKQTLILPPDLNEWLPPNHLARIVAQVVDNDLDLAPLVASYANEEGGRPVRDGGPPDRLALFGEPGR